MSDATVTVTGNVASDVQTVPVRKEEVASFRLASQRRYLNRRTGRWVDDEPSFYRIVCWRPALAENVAKSVKKGEPVVVQGRLKLKDWTDANGNQRTDAEIDAWSVAYDLVRGTAEFTRTRRQLLNRTDDGDPLDALRSEQRARAEDEVIEDPATGEMFHVSELQRERSIPGGADGSAQQTTADADADGDDDGDGDTGTVPATADGADTEVARTGHAA
ncbi:single stranded DNA-binding protein [Haloactinopolyspora alba]|uniref:Single-stranded DNA-binding protein n=1 Tax=Haloactinopolyspora alba TaxID=648780 RepID=A0A2P8DHE9_9ACTN|nr:single-stranded DNA-binding protein [Haloactinopolyspora alba]PSK96644.1 single stranded DNA-binding protein [Haloactinopolyspora alba]